MFVRRRKLAAHQGDIRQHFRPEVGVEPARGCSHHGLERRQGPVVMRVAVGEREAANALGMPRGEDLRDSAAAVVRDEIYGFERERRTEIFQHAGLGAER